MVTVPSEPPVASSYPAIALLFEVGIPASWWCSWRSGGTISGAQSRSARAADRLSPSPFLVLPDSLTAFRPCSV